MLRYVIANLPRAPQVSLSQQAPQNPAPSKPSVPATVVNLGIVVLGLGMSVAGYYGRKTDLGMIGMGAGSSITGAGIVLLILDFAGFKSSGQV